MEKVIEEFYWYFLSLSFVFGTIWGSFFNVCIFRIPKGESIVFPGSHCTSCGKEIAWYDNIPVLSYFILKGKCRHCHTKFSMQYALVELFTGLVFAGIYLTYGFTFFTLFYWVAVSLLIIGSGIDLRFFILPEFTTRDGAILSLIAFAIFDIFGLSTPLFDIQILFFKEFFMLNMPEHSLFLLSFSGALLGTLFFLGLAYFGKLAFKKEALGGGDILLIAFLGSCSGPLGVLLIIFFASLSGAVIGLIAMSLGKKKQASEEEHVWEDEDFDFIEEGFYLPFGPFLALAGLITILWGKACISFYTGL